jgi:predicted O-linked N-acetylglucosamine transferase (SPINDLY family)
MMNNLNPGQGVAEDDEAYLFKAIAFAGDCRHLAERRRSMRKLISRLTIRDEASFAQAVEMAYQTMYRRWRTSELATPFDVVSK